MKFAGLTRTTPPPSEILTAADVRTHLRIETTAEDALLLSLVTAARAALEERTGLSLAPGQVWRVTLDCFPAAGAPIELPRAPVTSVTSMAYDDTAGVEQALDPDGDEVRVLLDSDVPRIARPSAYSLSWPRTNRAAAVRIDYAAGYTAANLPPDLRHAMLLLVGHYYENREATQPGNMAPVDIPHGVAALVAPWRRWAV